MFFSISKNFDPTFPNHIERNSYHIYYDNGWTLSENFLYKGTTETGVLNIDSENDIEKYKSVNGTFCILDFRNNNIDIIYGNKQKFPLFQSNDTISNLYITENSINNPITITPNSVLQHDVSSLVYTDLGLSDKEVIDLLDSKISNYVTQFKSPYPLKIYPTGGVDSILLIAYVLKYNIPYELVNGEHAEMDHFLCNHRLEIPKKFWAYQTVQHWKKPSILVTGAHGDETLLRDPLQASVMLNYHGEDLVQVCKDNPNLYQSRHCLKPECLDSYQKNNHVFDNEYEMKTWILNTFRYDYQHWHLGNTLFFAPLDNIDLLNISLNLSYKTARKQLLDAEVSKELIRMNRPGLLQLVSPLKNIDYYKNLSSVFEGTVKLEEL